MARVRSALRRARLRDEGQRLEVADVVLDARARRVTRGARPVELTPREFDLLELFMRAIPASRSAGSGCSRRFGATSSLGART